MKTVGILGGFGPETTAKFYTSIVDKNRTISDRHPNIVIHSVPVPFELEKNAVGDGKDLKRFLPLLLGGLKRLEGSSDFIVLPCNTLHVFIDDLREASKIPVVSIFEETVKQVKRSSMNKVGLLATPRTFEDGILESKLNDSGVEVIKPDLSGRCKISDIINSILNGTELEESKHELLNIINEMKNGGAEAVILGCTDLQLLIKQSDSSLQLIDTMDVLANSVIEMCIRTCNAGKI